MPQTPPDEPHGRQASRPPEESLPNQLREKALEIAQERLGDADGDTPHEQAHVAYQGAREMTDQARRQLMTAQRVEQLLKTKHEQLAAFSDDAADLSTTTDGGDDS